MQDAIKQRMLIDGDMVAGLDDKWFEVRNPANGAVIALVPKAGRRDVDVAVAAARRAATDWSRTAPAERRQIFESVADAIATKNDAISRRLAEETGNALRTQSRPEVQSAVDFIRYFADTGGEMKGQTIPVGASTFNYTVREPLGVVGAIIPWNTPVTLTAVKLAMALATGNTIVLKTAEDAPLAALEVAKLFAERLPRGAVNVLTGYGDDCGQALVRHPDIDKVTFTGSTAVGKSIMAAASERILPLSLELGGKNPAIVFADSDNSDVASGVIAGMRFARQGQSCTAGSRLLLHESIYESFLSRVAAKLGDLHLGDPNNEETDIGTLVNRKQYERVRGYVLEAVDQGASLRVGQIPPEADEASGLYIEPIILTNVEPDWRVAREEIFGPVLVVIPWSDPTEAIKLANDTHYGLAAYVWCRDISTALNAAHSINAGWVQVNRGLGQLPGMTYGGFKESGLVAECSHEAAIAAFTRSKTVTVGV